MPTPIRELLSQTSYNTDGVTTAWNFSFAGGYLDKAHVKVQLRDNVTGLVTQHPIVLGDFIGAYQLSLTPAFPVGSELTIYRDTPKDLPLVNFADKASLTEVSLDINAQQAIFVAAESDDTLSTSLTAVSEVAAQVDAATDAATAAAASAVTAGTQAGIATAQAVISTAQAVISTTKAAEAAASAASIAGGPVASVAGLTGIVTGPGLKTAMTFVKADVGLGNVDNTSDAAKPVSTAQATADQVIANLFPQTSVYFKYASSTTVTLEPEKGGYLWINGTNRPLTAALTKGIGTLVTATIYYVYAFWTGTAIDLEYSTTAFTKHAATGIPQKNADATRTLVGWFRTNSTTTTYNTSTDCGVMSYWNRKRRSILTILGSNVPTASGTPVGIFNAGSVLSWGDDITDLAASCNIGNGLDTAQNSTAIYIDGAAASQNAQSGVSGAGGVTHTSNFVAPVLSSGYHTITLFGFVNANTGTWYTGCICGATFWG